MRRLTPVSSSNFARTAACTFSYTRGTLGSTVGRTASNASRRAQRIRKERDRVADVGAGEVHQPPEVVRERQVEEQHVVCAREVLELVDDGDHLVVVAVADHAGLRRPRRPRRVHVGEEVVRAHGRSRFAERIGMLARVARALARAVRRAPRTSRDARAPRDSIFVRCSSSSHRAATASECVDDVLRVLRRAVRVDGSGDRTDEREREVEKRPLERRLADDRNGVALANADREKTVCELVDGLRGVLPRHGLPAVVALDEVRRRRALRGDGVEPQATDRSRLRNEALGARGSRPAPREKRSGGAHCRQGEKRRSLYNRGSHADDLERLTQLRPGQHPRGSRARDVAEGARVRRVVPAAAPRVPDADPAEALVHDTRP